MAGTARAPGALFPADAKSAAGGARSQAMPAPMTGLCRSRLEILPDGRYRLHEDWQWTGGDKSRGTSTIEEVRR